MSLKKFNYWVTKLNHLDFSAVEKENKIIQITDLNRFIECYDPSLEIIECIEQNFCIIEKDNLKREITITDISNINNKITKTSTKESWFVLVNDKLDNAFKSIVKIIEDHQINKKYDKVFIFNFFQSSIHEIK